MKKNMVLAVLATLLLLTPAVESAWSYFTTYTQARGSHNIKLGSNTTIKEDFSNWTKRVVIESAEDSQPVYVRAKVFYDSEYPLEYVGSANGKWYDGGDGYYYYKDILYGGEDTEELLIQIKEIPESTALEGGEEFQVIVIYESVPVLYAQDGNPYDVKTNFKLVSQKAAEGGSVS